MSDLLGAIKLYNSKEMSVLYCFLTVDQSLNTFLHLCETLIITTLAGVMAKHFSKIQTSFFKPCHNGDFANITFIVNFSIFCWIVDESSRYQVEESQLWIRCPESRTHFLSGKDGGSCLITKKDMAPLALVSHKAL